MKFAQLQIGQRFSYRDTTYRKATPLMADIVDGEGQRLIPRSASVRPLGAAPPPPEPQEPVPLAQLDRAMRQLASDMEQALGDSGLEAGTADKLLRELQGALVRCRQNLNLP